MLFAEVMKQCLIDVVEAGGETRGRVRFYDENGEGNSPTHGHTFMYFGRRKKRFSDEFRQYGWIVKGV